MTFQAMKPTVSPHAIAKTASTLQGLVEVYFPMYGLKPAEFFTYFPVLVYTEALIYQIDEENESNIYTENFMSSHWEELFDFLEYKELLDKEIKEECAKGLRYYELERKMCSGKTFTFEELVEAHTGKAFDYRVLHRLLYKLRKQPYDETMLKAFALGEMMADVEEDIGQYEEETARNVFNVYRMFAKLYREEAPKKIKEYLDNLTKQVYQTVAQAPRKYRLKFKLALKLYRALIPAPKIPQPILNDCIPGKQA